MSRPVLERVSSVVGNRLQVCTYGITIGNELGGGGFALFAFGGFGAGHGERGDDFSEGGERFVDVGTFFQSLTGGTGGVGTLGTCKIDQTNNMMSGQKLCIARAIMNSPDSGSFFGLEVGHLILSFLGEDNGENGVGT